MKKHVVSLLLLWGVVFGVWAEKGFVIQGSVDGITPQSMISLYRVDNGKRSLLDKAYVTRGRFKLTGKTAGSTAEEVYIMLSDKKSPSRTLALWVLPGAKIKVFGDNRIAALWTVESDVAEQKESNLYAAAVRPFLAEYWNNYPEKAKLETLYRDKNTPREKRSAVRKQINAITAKQDSIQSLMYKAEIDIMQTAPVGDIWLMHLAQLAMVSRTQKNFPYKAELVNLYENRMTDVLKAKEYGVVARANLFQRTVDVGDALVDAGTGAPLRVLRRRQPGLGCCVPHPFDGRLRRGIRFFQYLGFAVRREGDQPRDPLLGTGRFHDYDQWLRCVLRFVCRRCRRRCLGLARFVVYLRRLCPRGGRGLRVRVQIQAQPRRDGLGEPLI